MSARLEPIALLGPIDGEADVRARNRQAKQDKFDQEPCPAATGTALARHRASRLLAVLLCVLGAAVGSRAAGVLAVQVMRPHCDDVVVVRELACLGGEAQVGDGRDLEVGDFEALCPFVDGLVLQLELEVLVLEVGQAGFGRDLGVADAASLGIVSDFMRTGS
jgi:hypothetical protein